MNIKTAIADDHKIVREGIKAMLGGEPWIEIVGEASDGEEMLELLERKKVDVVLLDIDMPCMDGICCAKVIRKFWPQTRILFVSMHESEKFIINAFRAGADGYISKDSGKSEIINAVRTLAEGNSYFSKEVSQKIYTHLNRPPERRAPSDMREKPQLTAREAQVLALIAKEYTNQEIADKLFISPHTVVSHRRNLLQKLQAKNSAGLVHHAARFGLLKHQ